MSHINRYYMKILTCNACEEAKTHSVGSGVRLSHGTFLEAVKASQEPRAIAIIDPEQLVCTEQAVGTKELCMHLDGFIMKPNY